MGGCEGRGMGEGGLSILVHGVRALMQQSPGLVCVKLDLRNAFNEVERAALVEAVYSYPELHDLVPLMVKTYAPETTAVMGRRCEALFEGERGDVSQGGPQGNPLMGVAFCLAIHPYVKKLHDRLTREGGCSGCARWSFVRKNMKSARTNVQTNTIYHTINRVV